MNGDRAVQFIWMVGMLALVGGAVLRRRIPIGQAAKIGAAWVVIFALAFGFVAFRHDFNSMWAAVKARAVPESGVVAGRTLRIAMADDGHFWVRGTVNGSAVRFLVDSGATTTALSVGAARGAGIDPAGESLGVPTDTANGAIVARRITIDRLSIGPIERTGFVAVTAPEFGETNVLGMNFLSTLRRWSVEGNTLILES